MPGRHVSGTRAGKKEKNMGPLYPVLSNQGAILLADYHGLFRMILNANKQPPCSSHHLTAYPLSGIRLGGKKNLENHVACLLNWHSELSSVCVDLKIWL